MQRTVSVPAVKVFLVEDLHVVGLLCTAGDCSLEFRIPESTLPPVTE